jgi:pimeloyl-ACP methyl ester carboxylesterase
MPADAYGRIRCPVRIVRGEHARGPSRLIAEELARLLPLGSLEVQPGAGHMGPLTHPGEVNRLIAGFILANPARTRGQLAATPIAA